MTINITREIKAAYGAFLDETVDTFTDGTAIKRRETHPFDDNHACRLVEFAAGWQAARADARAALQGCLDVMLRMIPDACEQHSLEQTTDRQHNDAIAGAAAALHGDDRSAWPSGAREAAEGEYDL